MDKKSIFFHLLIITTALTFALLIAIGIVYETTIPPQTNELMVEGRPRIGHFGAKIEMVLIEDLRCGGCYYFFEKVFPQIYEKYIETGRAYCVFIPVSFLTGSQPLANAALAVNKIAPDRFMAYVHEIFETFHGRASDGFEKKELIAIAKRVGGIDIKQLRECIDSDCYSQQLERNFDWAKRIMGGKLATPALYVNGIKTSTVSIDAFQARVEKLGKKK